jgi:DNA-binding protein HU-beta
MLSDKSKLDPSKTKQAIDAILDNIMQTVASGERVEIRGFGTFAKKHYRTIQARNPMTGKTLIAKATARAKFRASYLTIGNAAN